MNARRLARVLVVLIAVAALSDAYGNDGQFPVSFKFHCGGKARNSVPKAMGFSPDSKTLAVWYIRDLILVDAWSGREVRRLKTAVELSGTSPYNYVAFDKTGKYCCIAQVHGSGFDLQIIDLDQGVGSEPVKHIDQRNWTLSTWYKSTVSYLPLRQWLAFQEVRKDEGNFEAIFSRKDDSQQSRRQFDISFEGDESLTMAEKVFSAMDANKSVEAARNVGNYAGDGMQVVVSSDRKTLLTQFIGKDVSSAWYRFCFYDVGSKALLTEIRLSTGYPYRHGVSRGFAFSPDLRRLVRSVRGGHVIVHELSSVVDRKIDGSSPVTIPADYGMIDK